MKHYKDINFHNFFFITFCEISVKIKFVLHLFDIPNTSALLMIDGS